MNELSKLSEKELRQCMVLGGHLRPEKLDDRQLVFLIEYCRRNSTPAPDPPKTYDDAIKGKYLPLLLERLLSTGKRIAARDQKLAAIREILKK